MKRNCTIPTRGLAGALALALLASAPALAQQGESIGSWWFIEMAGAPEPRHAIMTLSTQGSGVIAIQCAGGKPTVLVGLNRPEIRPPEGETALSVELQLGSGGRQPAQATRTSEDTIESTTRPRPRSFRRRPTPRPSRCICRTAPTRISP
jgi:hypothetical protein